jgi:gamma-glutamyltranspeptidase/glutathione hydrolase
VFTRYAVFGQGMQQAISAPRWLLGRTWGQASDTLKLESRFDSALVADYYFSSYVQHITNRYRHSD